MLKLKEAAAYLNIPQAELQRLGLGLTRLGGRVLFDKNAIDAALDRLNGIASTVVFGPDDAEAALARFTQSF